MIGITLNGKPGEIERPQTVTDLLQTLNVRPEQVAVAVNGEVVSRDTWAATTIKDGDVVEIVRAVGGGAGMTHRILKGAALRTSFDAAAFKLR